MTGRDWGHEAHQAAQARLEVLEQVQEAMCCGEEVDEELYEQLSGLVCEGCQTCTIREILDAAWPVIVEAIRSGDFDERPLHGGLFDAAKREGRLR